MLTTLALLLASPPPALYQATFVPMERGAAVTEISDARSDFQAVGYTMDHGPDWFRMCPVAVFGKSVLKRVQSDWMPQTILGRNRFTVVFDPGLGKPVQYRRATAANGKLKLGTSISNAPWPTASLKPIATSDVAFPREWWSYRHKDPEGWSPAPPVQVSWYVMPGGQRVGSGWYNGGPPPDVYFYSEYWMPMLDIGGGKTYPLRHYVKGPKGLDLGQIAYVSKQGWMILRADLNGQDGLAWLHPLKAKR